MSLGIIDIMFVGASAIEVLKNFGRRDLEIWDQAKTCHVFIRRKNENY
jgi:hypothetical protein